jgi:histidine ammonia-lyase
MCAFCVQVKAFEADVVEALGYKGAIATNVRHTAVTKIHMCILYHHVQVKAFEADVVEALGYKGAIAAADELKGLLDGSKVAGSRKGLAAEQQALFSNLPQVRKWMWL